MLAPPSRRSALWVPLACVVVGAAGYVFLILSARALGPEKYAPLAALWALVFTVAPGLFLPLEQEVTRAVAHRTAEGTGARPVIRQAAAIGAGLLAAAAVLAGISGPWLTERLFAGESMLLLGLLAALVGYALAHFLRGVLAATGQRGGYALTLVIEGLVRVVAVVPLALLSVTSVGVYGLVVGGAPLVAALCLLPLVRRRGWTKQESAPPPVRGELVQGIGLLLVSSMLSQTLINVGPIVVALLAEADEAADAGRLLAGLALVRVPVLAFSAFQAALLPALTRTIAEGALQRLRRDVLRLAAGMTLLTLLALPVAAFVGPALIRLLFGPEFALSGVDLALLALGACAYTLALVMSMGLIAGQAQGRLAAAWCAGIGVAVLVVLLVPGLLLRVELALATGAATSAVLMLLLVLRMEPDEAAHA